MSSTARDGRILLLAKAPEPGRAKTRLIPELGADGAAELQARLIRHTLDRTVRPGMQQTVLWCAPDSSHAFFQEQAGRYSLSLHDQVGADLGERMLFAVRNGLSRAEHVILLGTDSPELSPDRIRRAADILASGRDAVLGPAEDGGYVLLGLSTLCEALFRDIPWGTEGVLQATRGRIAECGLTLEELPPCGDLDRTQDLERLRDRGGSEIWELLRDLFPRRT